MTRQQQRHLIAAALVASSAALAVPAHAQFIDPQAAGPYVGVGAGASRMKGEDLPDAPTDRSDTGAKVFAGYRFNSFLSTEIGAMNTGRFDTSAGSLRGQGVYLDAIGRYPLTTSLSATGRLGAFYGKLKDGRSGTQITDEGANVKGGLGLQYDLTKNHALSAEWERYRFDGTGTGKVNTDLYTVGYKYNF
jgi:OmpA-OmpF porin, OOP family